MRLRLVVALLAIVAAAGAWPDSASAQGSDIIRGRVTGQDSLPLEGARVTVTSVVSMIERVVRTDKNGRYTVVFPGADGQYFISISTIGYLVKAFELKRTADQDILVADAHLTRPMMDAIVVTADQTGVRGTVPRGLNDDISGTTQGITGISADMQGNLAAMAATIPGVLLIPGMNGAADGFSVLGLDPSDNTITMNGMTFNGGDLPRDANISSSLSTSPYDVSRGGFSGAELSLRSGSGTNILKQGMSLNMNLPQLHWSDMASRATGTRTTALSWGGAAAGPLKVNSSFYDITAQVDRSSRPLQTLLNTSAFGLQSQGVSADSVDRMLGVLSGLGVPSTSGRSLSDVMTYNARLFGSFNFNPPTSTAGTQYGITVNGSWTNNEPTQLGATVLPSYGGQSTNTSFGLTARHTTYFKIFLTETSVGVSRNDSKSSPFTVMPSGSVRVNSIFGDGTNQIKNLNFGGNPSSSSSSAQESVNFTNTLSWFSTNNKHRLRLSTELRHNSSHSDQSTNYLGTFRFNSLADLEAGIPASYSRTLGIRRDNSAQYTGAVSLGDSYRHSPDLQFQYGVRVDGASYQKKPEYNATVENIFGVRNDFVPNRLYVSPRIGFSWTLGTAQQLSLFDGAVRGPRAVVRGGITINQNAPGSISSVVNNTGLPNSIQSLNCVGPATPIPDWDAYLSDPTSIPETCADGTGGTVFSNSSPSVTLYSRDYRSPKSLRSNLSWSGAILDNRFGLNLSATHSLNLNRSSTVDLNFSGSEVFALDSEGGRPVFVQTSSIVPTTGSIASRDARVSDSFSRVNEMRSDLRSETIQLQVNLSPRNTNPNQLLRLSGLSYVFQDVREQQRGFSSTVGNPLDIFWSRGTNTARHQFGYNLSFTAFRFISVSWNGRLMSGTPWTPTISGDVNGDGSSNDRPFIFDPATTADPAMASAMDELLRSTSSDARKCLRKQLGQLARRNSCETGWTMTGDLNIGLDQARLRLPNRTQLQLSFQNPMGGLDMLVNGTRNPKGWGTSKREQIDPTLLYVRGFDPETKTFKYEVNQGFGAARRNFQSISINTGVSLLLRMDVGPTRERQNLNTTLAYGRSQPGTKYPAQLLKSTGTSGLPNPITTILRLQDSLRLTTEQADSMATLNRRYTVQLDSIWSVAAQHFYDLPVEFDGGAAWHRYLQARRAAVDMMVVIAPQLRAMLNASQLRKLPPQMHNMMDPRYLIAIRNGNGTYVTPSSGFGGVGGGAQTFVSSAGGAAISREVIIR